MKTISNTPKHGHGIQDSSERYFRIKAWGYLLKKTPHLTCCKHTVKMEYETNFIKNNPHLFRDSVYIYRSDNLIQYHPGEHTFVYFCFKQDGTYSITIESNVDNAYLLKMIKHRNKAWHEGYRIIIRILKKFFPKIQAAAKMHKAEMRKIQ